MNLSARFRKFPRLPAKSSPRATPPPAIEALEARIAPATLLNGSNVTYTDQAGETVTVHITKSLFTAANVGKVFTFDTGSVNGNNSVAQQLELLDITKLGHAAKGMDITITAVPVNNSPGVVNVGYINASGIDLGNVSVGGDLGRIAAGDLNYSTPGLHSLTVNSLGAEGVTTQAAGGNLNTLISGPVGSITVNGDIDNASIGIGGGAKGSLGTLTVTGSIDGYFNNLSGTYAGSVRTQGGIGTVTVEGSIIGGTGDDSGIIGTAGALGTVTIDGSITGGGGQFSGAILSTKAIQSITIDGALAGGSGPDSGQVGTASNLVSITVGGSVTGSGGALSGTILATGSMTTVTIDGSLSGGDGPGSGQIGSAASIGAVTIYGQMSGGAEIHAHQNIQSIAVHVGTMNHLVLPGLAIDNGIIAADLGSIGSITANASSFDLGGPTPSGAAIQDTTIIAGGNIGSIQVVSSDGVAYGMLGTNVTAGSIGNISSDATDGPGICGSHFVATQGIGNIEATGGGAFATADGVLNSTFQAGAGIASITATSSTISPALANAGTSEFTTGAIFDSGFDAGGSIGPINTSGSIIGSVFIAGIDLGTGFSVTGAGSFDTSSAASFGFGSSQSSVAAHIGAITVSLEEGNVQSAIDQSTFLAGVHGAGSDGMFGTKDDSVATGSSIGAIISPGGLNTVFMESGNIGATTSGEIVATTYIATDTAVSAGGIGAITVYGNLPFAGIPISVAHPSLETTVSSDDSHGIYNSSFITNAGIGPVDVTLSGTRVDGENGGISSSLFQAGHAIGTVTVTDNASGTGGTNYGIYNTHFNAGLNGNGGVGDISSTLTDAGPDGNSAAIADIQVNGSVCACMGANLGSISAENADSASSAAGILDSVFRVYGNIGDISATMDSGVPTATAIEGSTFSAYGSIQDINVYGSVMADAYPTRFLAGYDIGSSNLALSSTLPAVTATGLHAGQSIGNVTITGYFQDSDIIASINPGSSLTFGADDNTNVGAGGTIGMVNIGTQVSQENSPFTFDQAAPHAIEAANFISNDSPTVTAFGYTADIPVVLVDGGSGNVRITNLTQANEG